MASDPGTVTTRWLITVLPGMPGWLSSSKKGGGALVQAGPQTPAPHSLAVTV